ncbi:MAG TPA: hypothetical protein PLU53_12590, partial [Bacteroidia bacterium]|nr:hypothetical protein [Bacteroidia bacterium]
QDVLGTFMMIENSSVPFITEIPGFNGYLTPRYCLTLSDWKDPVIFKYSPEEIQNININYTRFPERNLYIARNGEKIKITGNNGQGELPNVDSVAVDNYFALYNALYYESRENQLTEAQHDSLAKTPSVCTVTVTDKQGNNRRVIIYPMPINEKSLTQQDTLGNPLKYDVDRMIGFIEQESEWVVIQHYTFDRIFRTPADFDSGLRRKRNN